MTPDTTAASKLIGGGSFTVHMEGPANLWGEQHIALSIHLIIIVTACNAFVSLYLALLNVFGTEQTFKM